jgi:hypothetical protein
MLESTFIDLCNLFEVGVWSPICSNSKSPNSILPSTFHAFGFLFGMKPSHAFLDPNNSNVIKCLKTMSFIPIVSNELETLNYDIINIHNVSCLLMSFDGDIIFWLSPLC